MGVVQRGRDDLLELVDTDPPRDAVAVLAPPPSPALMDFEAFYRQEFARLVVLARILAGPALAEDVAQEAMLVAFSRWEAVRRFESPAGWVRTVCLHKTVSMLRRRGVEQRLLRQLGSFRSDLASVAGEDEWFWRAVRALPPRQAQTVALYYGLDLPVAEVALALDCAEGTVKVHLARARASLATVLSVPPGRSP
jgi:RNA polymerase sigma-70 factor (ECF subfamily)